MKGNRQPRQITEAAVNRGNTKSIGHLFLTEPSGSRGTREWF